MSCDVDNLPHEFQNILKSQPEYIKLTSDFSQNQEVVGTYKKFPYYQKVWPKLDKNNVHDSRFVIQKHMVSCQWQLTKFSKWPFPSSEIIQTCGHTITEEKENIILFEANQRFKQNQIEKEQ